MNKRGIITAVISLFVSVAVIIAVIMPHVNRQSVLNEEKTAIAENGEKIPKPTFMYFAKNEELVDKTTKKTLDELSAIYGDKVIFEIKNVDADKQLLEDFPVKDNTPALIMLDSNGDITNIMFKTNECEKLKSAVDAVLEK